MQPAGQDAEFSQLGSAIGQGEEYALRHVFRQMGILRDAQCGGINEVNIAVDQFGKRRLGSALRIILQKLLVSLAAH